MLVAIFQVFNVQMGGNEKQKFFSQICDKWYCFVILPYL